MHTLFKRLTAHMPPLWQQELKRHLFRRRILQHRYGADEPEVALLEELVSPGDWVIDVGANVGHYTLTLSELVGPTGRVLAFEPVPESFELLAAAARLAPAGNITLFNAAASDSTAMAGMSIPSFPSGIRNYYRARLDDRPPDVHVLCLPIDALALPQPVTLVKIDAEGHELAVLRGMRRLLERDHPVLVIEDSSPEMSNYLRAFGYAGHREAQSPNCVYSAPNGAGARVPSLHGVH